MPLGGGAREIIAEQQGLPDRIAIAGDWVYWVGFVGNTARASLVDGQVEELDATFGNGERGSTRSLLVTGDRLVVLTSTGAIHTAPHAIWWQTTRTSTGRARSRAPAMRGATRSTGCRFPETRTVAIAPLAPIAVVG